MQRSNLISIITVTKDDLKNLRETLYSVQEQTFDDYEHLIVDGLSVDGTQDHISKGFFKNVKLISEPDAGLYDAMNKGIAGSTGKYVLFLNAGDLLHDPNVLRLYSEKIKNNDQKLYYGDVLCFTNCKPFKRRKVTSLESLLLLKHYRPPAHPSMIFPRHFLEEYRYDQKYHIAADHKLKLEAMRYLKVEKIKYTCSNFLVGGVSTTSKPSLIIKGLKERAQIEFEHWGLIYLPMLIVKMFILTVVRLRRVRFKQD